MEKYSNKLRTIADLVGLCGSTICALHCLLLPILLVSSTTLPTFFLNDQAFHTIILWLVLPTALTAFAMGCWKHKDIFVIFFGLLGIVGLCLSAVWLHDVLGESGERAVTLLASASLIIAHIRNWRICRAQRCEHQCDSH